MSMSTEESRSRNFCAQAWCNGLLSLACQCLLEREFRSSAGFRAMYGSIMSRHSIIQADWLKANTKSSRSNNVVRQSFSYCKKVLIKPLGYSVHPCVPCGKCHL